MNTAHIFFRNNTSLFVKLINKKICRSGKITWKINDNVSFIFNPFNRKCQYIRENNNTKCYLFVENVIFYK
jgi:hypothetical protein